MKIQYLTVVFILIIMPIVIVFSEYINNEIETIQTEYEYDTRLLNSTYDAIKAYQLNTVNNSLSDRPEEKVSDIEAAVSTFYNSLVTSFGYSGYNSSVMDEYIPAVIFCLYDGYYIYSPFENIVTGIDTNETSSSSEGEEVYTYDQDYADNEIIEGVKTYIYYNCHYTGNSYDITITYTLDNFITVDGYVGGTDEDDYIYKSGYLLDLGDYSDIRGISSGYLDDNCSFSYNGVVYSYDNSVELKEYYGETEYSYTKIDGTKFYLDTDKEEIFYIDSSGEKQIQASKSSNETLYNLYYNAITSNIDDFIYYRDAYNFTYWVYTNLGNLDVSSGIISGNDSTSFNTSIPFSDYTDIQDSDSDFNEHRQQVIRSVIETNLSTAITAYGEKYAEGSSYIMPNISETDWELIENNICIATFMQGLNIGGKVYNGYSVVANNLNKEYVDENDIYILTSDGTYTRANDSNLLDSSTLQIQNLIDSDVRTAGTLKIDFERRSYIGENSKTIYYFPKSYKKDSNLVPYLASYTGVVSSATLNSILSEDMYRYIENNATDALKTAYYSALGRERAQCYNVQNGLYEEETAYIVEDVSSPIKIDNWYYLKNYNEGYTSINTNL